MTLAPLANAPLIIQLHALLALGAVVLTIGILSLPKGSPLHRTMGWTWVLMMGSVAVSSFWIHTIKWIGPFSPIHFLSLIVLYSLVRAIRDARAHRITSHKRPMQGLVWGALLVAGAFTLLPGRLMHAVLLGS
ncbi:DUF2306 domain-containing protein [Sulfitobacter sp.]|uniref:DUF2306 domain-containing protein n=1 Tax=Sulfitobacter sp. TaxID=1903071 RepID=UPI003003412A